jgi:polyferredoxin
VFAGRVWCGYTCPQSSWTWMFMWCENHRRRTQPAHQAASRALGPEQTGAALGQAHLWLAISLLTGLTFVGYFTPIRPLAEELLTWQTGGVSLFWVLFFTGPPTSMPAGCAKRCACTCAPMRASRA